MTDRHTGYVVILDDHLRSDDAEEIIAALRMVKDVRDVRPIVTDLTAETIAVMRRDGEWRETLADAVRAMAEK